MFFNNNHGQLLKSNYLNWLLLEKNKRLCLGEVLSLKEALEPVQKSGISNTCFKYRNFKVFVVLVDITGIEKTFFLRCFYSFRYFQSPRPSFLCFIIIKLSSTVLFGRICAQVLLELKKIRYRFLHNESQNEQTAFSLPY